LYVDKHRWIGTLIYRWAGRNPFQSKVNKTVRQQGACLPFVNHSEQSEGLQARIYKDGELTMNKLSKQYVGVDISEDHLDVYVHPLGQMRRLRHDDQGMLDLVSWLHGHEIVRVVMEGTGGLQRRLQAALQRSSIPVSVVNPEKIWAWRRLVGQSAKTDTIDARLIALYAEKMLPPEDRPVSEHLQETSDLTRRRQQLLADLEAEQKRLRLTTHAVLRKSLESHIRYLKQEIARFESLMTKSIRGDASLSEKYRIITSIPGVGTITAVTLIVAMPELGTVSNKEIASLAGVAPYANDSGKYKGRMTIRGGRSHVRIKLYMAAFNARRFNPVIAEFYDRLVKRGKSYRQALTACMRKLLVIINTMLAKNQVWTPSSAA